MSNLEALKQQMEEAKQAYYSHETDGSLDSLIKEKSLCRAYSTAQLAFSAAAFESEAV